MLEINDRKISDTQPPYIIAELSANHNGSLKRAKQSIKSAKDNGADAVKIQTYTPDTMTIDSDKKDFLIKGGLWDGYKLYDLYHEAYTPFEWHNELFNYSSDIGITIFSSAFDESAVDLLEELGTPAYKIASFELCDTPLIRYIASKKKPILMSTGMASPEEVDEAIKTSRELGCEQLLLFHCISSYPAPLEEANLSNIPYLKERYGVEVGLSDHTIGDIASIVAISLGAVAIEKHYTISRKQHGPDSSFSIEPSELKELIYSTKKAWLSLGQSGLIRAESEMDNRRFRRSLYFIKNKKKGEKVKSTDIRRIRPGYGLSPSNFENIIGRRLNVDVERGDSVQWDLFTDE